MAATKAPPVKESIQLLLSILSGSAHDSPKVSPETIRQAKFNNPSSSLEILTLLHHTLQLLDTISTPDITPILLPHSPAEKDTKWLLMHVRKRLLSLGYVSRLGFYQSGDDVLGLGSRELLLALGWVVLQYDIVERVGLMCVQRLAHPLLPLKEPMNGLLEDTNLLLDGFKSQMEEIRKEMHENSLTLSSIERLVWLKGRLDKELRTLNRISHTCQKLSTRISEYTYSSKDSPLSLQDLYFLRHGERLKAYLKESETSLMLLKQCHEWSNDGGRARTVVSNWFNSVLELALKEEETSKPSRDLSSASLEKDIKLLEESVKKLQSERTCDLQRLEMICASSHRKISIEKQKEIQYRVQQKLCCRTSQKMQEKKEWQSRFVCSIFDVLSTSDESEVGSMEKRNKMEREAIKQQLKGLEEKLINTITIVQGREK
uniref:Tubulin epsilon and delta complex protein 1 domain-containing protein n=1 Tax=Amphimedon queenslandica TaxID=400682 RepID=A0A1X7VKA0_AMPQE